MTAGGTLFIMAALVLDKTRELTQSQKRDEQAEKS